MGLSQSMPAFVSILRVADGEELTSVLANVPEAKDSWVWGMGQIEAVELRVAADGADSVRALSGRYTLVSLLGAGRGPFSVTLARVSDAGQELLGGVLVSARSAGVTLALSPAKPPVSIGGSAAGWARARAISAKAAAADELDELADGRAESSPQAGNLVDHFAFGLCDVLQADGDRLRIRDVKGSGRIREVSLSVLEVLPPIESEGRQLFRLVRKRRGG